jgi:hypothetical protein
MADDLVDLERVAKERARMAAQRAEAETMRAVQAREEAERANTDYARRRHEREADTYERAAAAHCEAQQLQERHAEHSRQMAERHAGD